MNVIKKLGNTLKNLRTYQKPPKEKYGNVGIR